AGPMDGSTPARKAATELEQKLTAGQTFDLDELLATIDQPMHDELCTVFRSALSREDREDLARDVLVELMENPSRYHASRCSIEGYAKLRVRTLAIDFLKRRHRTGQQQQLFRSEGYLLFGPEPRPGPLECEEHERKIAEAMERVKLVILELPINH